VGVVAQPRTGYLTTHASERTSRHALFGVSAQLFAASAAVTMGDGCRAAAAITIERLAPAG
jgi:hypothetical protein